MGVFFFPPTVENVHNVPHNFPPENFAGARKSKRGSHMNLKQSLNHSIKDSIKAVNVALSVVLLLSPLSLPAHADFKYTDSTKMTGGSLYGLMKFAARFSKKGENPLDPVVTSRYIKGGRLRTDNSDGTVLIIDLEGRRVTTMNTLQKTYSTATFDEIKAAMEQAMQQMQQMQQQMQQQPPRPQSEPNPQNVQLNLTPKFDVTPGAGNRVILGVPTNETIMHMDLNVAATATPQPGDTTASGQPMPSGPQTVNGTMTMTVDMFMAPTVPGYQEIGEFYRRMAQEINWVPPSNIHVDPRVTQGLTELQKNSAEFKGLPMLETISMGMSVPPGQQVGQQTGQQTGQPTSSQDSRPNSSRPSNTSSRSDDIPTTPSAMIVKGLGGMFSKKKQPDNPPAPSSSSAGSSSAPTADNSQPMSATLMEMTTEVTSFSTSSLDSSVFEVPAGYTQIQAPPGQILGGRVGGPPQNSRQN